MSDAEASRRDFLKTMGAGIGAGSLPGSVVLSGCAPVGTRQAARQVSPEIMNRVSAFLVGSADWALPDEVRTKAKVHILDTLSAMVSGSTMKVGILARRFVKSQGGTPEAQVAGDTFLTNAITAALANGCLAHADETDDSHEPSSTHPGCAIIPAALAAAEKEGVDGSLFLNSVVAGYDIGCRINQALGKAEMRARNHATHAIGGVFGAASACAVAMRMGDTQIRYLMDYTGQQAAGMHYYVLDLEHVEKAFVFGGLPARSGVTAAVLVQSGFTGAHDCFSGEDNVFQTYSSEPQPDLLIDGLGERHEIMATNIKKYSVGSPIQAPVEALLILVGRHQIRSDDIDAIEVRVPGFQTVNDRLMPDINLQYCVAVAALDGGLSFEAAHDFERMHDPDVLRMKDRLAVVRDPSLTLPDTHRTARVTITLRDGTRYSEFVPAVPGTAQNPMSRDQVEEKCRPLLAPVIGDARAEELIATVREIEDLRRVRELRRLLSVR